jgi:pentatricopeptide repeat protein
MEVSGFNSTCVTYEHLINGYCVIGDLDSAVLLYKEAIRKEFRLEGFVIDAFVRGLCEKNRVCEAFEFYRVSVKEHGFYPKRDTYEFLIKGLCEEQKVDEALKLQAEMVGKGYNPNSETYNAFINMHMKLGNKEQAEKLIIEMNDQELRRSN